LNIEYRALSSLKILITGAAGFIGFHLSKRMLDDGYDIVGIDNLNPYYDVNLKQARISQLVDYNNFKFIKTDLADRTEMEEIFRTGAFDVVVNLAAQPGVRYSLTNPYSYIDSNIVGFANILEGCRHSKVTHLVFASSSSFTE
jgi:UDP-glucuronate 4-epimerase